MNELEHISRETLWREAPRRSTHNRRAKAYDIGRRPRKILRLDG